MMKAKKKFTPILLVAVLAIWGGIAYQVTNSLQQDPREISNYSSVIRSKSKPEIIADYQLDFGNGDPFRLKQGPVGRSEDFGVLAYDEPQESDKTKASKTKRKGISTKVKELKRKEQLKWPSIQYFGMVGKPEDMLCMIQIGDEMAHLREGEELDDFHLEVAFTDSVGILYNGNLRYFKKL